MRLFFSTPLAPSRELSVTLLLDPAKRVFLRTGNFWLSAVTRQFWDACGGARRERDEEGCEGGGQSARTSPRAVPA